jgi:glycosyltransferase involved in cell wall biosynthesis
MLEPWALRSKRWKKKVYWSLLEKRNLEGARCLRALTRSEAEHYRDAGLRQPIVIIPNGVEVPAEICPEPFYDRYPQLRGRRLLLFLGRIHPKKGLALLCQSWASICRDYPDAQLILAGPDSEGTKVLLEAQISALGIESRVTFAGMLRGNEKWAALRAATVFLLPSYSEGFSIAVLEAMGAGIPVIVSRQCYFPEVETSGSGWVIEVEATSLSRALRECLALSASELAMLGTNGRRLVKSRFQWDVVGRQTADVIDWILGGSEPCSTEIIQ